MAPPPLHIATPLGGLDIYIRLAYSEFVMFFFLRVSFFFFFSPNLMLHLAIISPIVCCLAKIIFANLFYYSTYFYYYSWVPLHFLILFMGRTILFQLTFTFIYNFNKKKFNLSKINRSQINIQLFRTKAIEFQYVLIKFPLSNLTEVV